MSTAAHTPGPWSIGVSCDRTPAVTVPQEQGSGFVVAHINRIPLMRGVRGDADANARLIAAAPDLLAACVDLTDQLALLANDPKKNPWVKQGRSAIAKAEGRSS